MRLIQTAINLAKQNNKNLLIFGGFLVLGIALPVFEAHAFGGPLGWIFENAIGGIGNLLLFIPTFFLVLIQMMLNLLVVIMGLLMDQILQFSLNIPYIPGDDGNKAVTVGWTIMRDLANSLLIIILALIGIGAMLGKDIEKLGSRIATFIGIALLINFTPVLTGVIIDISNIATKLFFDSVEGSWKLFVEDTMASVGSLGDFFSLDIAKGVSAMITAIISVFFNLFTLAAFILVSALLIARIAALWILVILSPLAFVAYILPATKKLFSDWWKNFWQWSIIGIPLGLFLFLSTTILYHGKEACKAGGDYAIDIQTGIGGIEGASSLVSGSSFLDNMCGSVIQIIALVVLFVGFKLTFKLSAAGAGLIMKGAMIAATQGRSLLNRKNLERVTRMGMGANIGTAKAALKAIRNPGQTARDLRAKAAEARRDPLKAVRGAGVKAVGAIVTPEEQRVIAERARELTGRTTKKGLDEELKKVEVDKDSPEKLLRWINNPGMHPNTKQAGLMVLAREHPKEFAKYAEANRGAAAGVFENAKRTSKGKGKDGKNQFDMILSKNPQYASEFATEIGKSTAEIVMKLTRSQISALSEEALGDSSVVSALLQNPEFNAGKKGGNEYLQNLLNRGEYKKLQALSKGLSGSLGGDTQKEKFEALERMAKSQAIPGRARENIQKMINTLRNTQANPQLQALGFLGPQVSPPSRQPKPQVYEEGEEWGGVFDDVEEETKSRKGATEEEAWGGAFDDVERKAKAKEEAELARKKAEERAEEREAWRRGDIVPEESPEEEMRREAYEELLRKTKQQGGEGPDQRAQPLNVQDVHIEEFRRARAQERAKRRKLQQKQAEQSPRGNDGRFISEGQHQSNTRVAGDELESAERIAQGEAESSARRTQSRTESAERVDQNEAESDAETTRDQEASDARVKADQEASDARKKQDEADRKRRLHDETRPRTPEELIEAKRKLAASRQIPGSGDRGQNRQNRDRARDEKSRNRDYRNRRGGRR